MSYPPTQLENYLWKHYWVWTYPPPNVWKGEKTPNQVTPRPAHKLGSHPQHHCKQSGKYLSFQTSHTYTHPKSFSSSLDFDCIIVLNGCMSTISTGNCVTESRCVGEQGKEKHGGENKETSDTDFIKPQMRPASGFLKPLLCIRTRFFLVLKRWNRT